MCRVNILGVELEAGDDPRPGFHRASLRVISTKHDPSIAVYPDSDRIGVWPPGKLFRASDAVDYWRASCDDLRRGRGLAL